MIRTTYTYAILSVSPATYREIAGKLKDAGYEDQFHNDRDGGTVIDMHGIALAENTTGQTELIAGHGMSE